MPSGPATAFAAPECRRPFPQITAKAERAKVTPAAARRLADLVTAAWMTFDDIAAIEELREVIAAVVGAPSDGSPVVPNGWTTRYAARRIAWHVLEHAWEMQDRAES